MTGQQAIEIAKAFGASQGRPFDDHLFETIFVAKKNRLAFQELDDVWNVWITYIPFKGIMTPDSCVVEVNCRTRQAILIRLL